MQATDPRIAAAKWRDAFPTVTTAYEYPWEDIELKAYSAGLFGLGGGEPAYLDITLVLLYPLGKMGGKCEIRWAGAST